jgi:transcription-repair coupling factor (superfamily II helicase)
LAKLNSPSIFSFNAVTLPAGFAKIILQCFALGDKSILNESILMMKIENQILSSFNTLQNLKKKIEQNEFDEKKIFVSHFCGSSRQIFVSSIIDNEKQILLLCPSVQLVNETKVELSILGLEDFVVSADDFTADSLQEQLTDLAKRERCILISTYSLLAKKIPSRNEIERNTTKIEIGSNLGYDELIEYLNSINYSSGKFVDSPGMYSIRGSIIDFWSYSEKMPVRLEYDGDFIESIRHFDPENQRSLDKIESVSIASSIEDNGIEYTGSIFDYLNNPLIFAEHYELEKVFSANFEKFEIDFIKDEIDDELIEELYDERAKKQAPKQNQVKDKAIDDLAKLFEKNARWIIEQSLRNSKNKLELNLSGSPSINSNYETLFNLVIEYCSKDFQVIIAVENELQQKRLTDLLSEFRNELAELIEKSRLRIIVIPIKSGFISKNDKLLVLTDYQIFNKPYRTKLSSSYQRKKSRTKDFASINKGDFVVHENFGIGKYAGLETIKIGQIEQESIKIIYAEGGIVYVNLNYLSLVKKFSSKENIEPKLSVLGSNEWRSTKKKVKSKIKDAARELISLYAKRKSAKGISFSPDSIWQKELEASFLYEDTPDQTKVTEEIKVDMENENPMDRLVCGDVGFGKTEVAVRAAFKAINDSKQVAMLVPTTILAEQHFNTFKDRLTQYPVRVEALSRFQSKAKQSEIINKLKNGEVDFVVGTHRLLSKDVAFRDLGLLIVDEEHRFGVMAKEKLRSLRTNVDTLSLTATPIPRTLNLSLLGARDLSIIATPPPNRQPIYTKVDTFNIHRVRDWVLNEIKRNGQIYFVHDRVQSIDKIASYLNKHIPEINIAVAHGQMKPSQLEKVIYDFLNKKYQMLVSTKIIESGIDIPNVNTIIINRADRFGLAELHQLRGRVGRSDRQAYAYFLVPSLNSVTKKAVKRLQAIEEYTDLGEGFSISMRDLEIRGAGNLLGTEQSGFIDSIGFDLYMKLLDEAVEELKSEEFKDIFSELPKHTDRAETTVDTFFEIGIPKDYMPDQADRLSFYTALFTMLKAEEADELREEMKDRFGKIPLMVERLIETAILRYFASYALFERIIIQKERTVVLLPKGDREDFYKNQFICLLDFINKNHSNEIKFVQDKENLKLEILTKGLTLDSIFVFLKNFFINIKNVISNKVSIS